MTKGASHNSRVHSWVRQRNEQALALARGSNSRPEPVTTTKSKTNQGERKMFFAKFIVRKHERALLFRDGDFAGFLEPGVHRFVTVLHKYTIERFDLTEIGRAHV